jgi:hypothetical protein
VKPSRYGISGTTAPSEKVRNDDPAATFGEGFVGGIEAELLSLNPLMFFRGSAVSVASPFAMSRGAPSRR